MSNQSNKYLSQASEYWRLGQPLAAGRLIFENLPTEVRPHWASHILSLVIEKTKVKSPPIEYIIEIASRPADWGKAHEAFSLARAVTLELNKTKVKPPHQMLLIQHMGLAELVAKVIYNATNPSDEFDEDSGWWIAVCLKNILDLLDDNEFSRSMWLVVCSGANSAHQP